MRCLVALLFCILYFAACGSGHRFRAEADYPYRTVTLNGSEYKYRLYIPKGLDSGKKTPVMLYLHGSGTRGDDNEQQITDILQFIEKGPEEFHFIIVFPQCRNGKFWAGEMTEQAVTALDQTVKEFNGDESRLYLAGFSMGGFGTWQTAVTYCGKFAAIVPIAGGIVPNGEVDDEQRAMLSPAVRAAADAPDPYRAFAEAIGKTPVWIVHGEKDGSVPVEGARKMFATLQAIGTPNVVYNELPGVEHYSVGGAFGDPKFFEWLAKQQSTKSAAQKLGVREETVYAVLLEDLVYRQNKDFGTDLGKVLLIKQQTAAPADLSGLRSLPDIEEPLANDFVENNKISEKISGQYDAKVAHDGVESKRSLKEIFEAPPKEKLPIGGVLTFSRVGFNEDRSQSLVYVEYYNADKGWIKRYCRLSWKRDGSSNMRDGVKWY